MPPKGITLRKYPLYCELMHHTPMQISSLLRATPTRFPGSSLTRCPRKTLRVFLALHPIQPTLTIITLQSTSYNQPKPITSHIPTSARNQFPPLTVRNQLLSIPS